MSKYYELFVVFSISVFYGVTVFDNFGFDFLSRSVVVNLLMDDVCPLLVT